MGNQGEGIHSGSPAFSHQALHFDHALRALKCHPTGCRGAPRADIGLKGTLVVLPAANQPPGEQATDPRDSPGRSGDPAPAADLVLASRATEGRTLRHHSTPFASRRIETLTTPE